MAALSTTAGERATCAHSCWYNPDHDVVMALANGPAAFAQAEAARAAAPFLAAAPRGETR